MPYASVDDLPSSVRAHLPPHAQEIYLAAFNNAWTEYQARGAEQRERRAHRVAWAAVKQKYLNQAPIGFHVSPGDMVAPCLAIDEARGPIDSGQYQRPETMPPEATDHP